MSTRERGVGHFVRACAERKTRVRVSYPIEDLHVFPFVTWGLRMHIMNQKAFDNYHRLIQPDDQFEMQSSFLMFKDDGEYYG